MRRAVPAVTLLLALAYPTLATAARFGPAAPVPSIETQAAVINAEARALAQLAYQGMRLRPDAAALPAIRSRLIAPLKTYEPTVVNSSPNPWIKGYPGNRRSAANNNEPQDAGAEWSMSELISGEAQMEYIPGLRTWEERAARLITQWCGVEKETLRSVWLAACDVYRPASKIARQQADAAAVITALNRGNASDYTTSPPPAAILNAYAGFYATVQTDNPAVFSYPLYPPFGSRKQWFDGCTPGDPNAPGETSAPFAERMPPLTFARAVTPALRNEQRVWTRFMKRIDGWVKAAKLEDTDIS